MSVMRMDSIKSSSTGERWSISDYGAEAHRCHYRGADLTKAFDNGTFSANVADGSFRDIFPGDYIIKDVTVPATALAETDTYEIKFIIADLDFALNREYPKVTEQHHVVIVPETPPFMSYMNSTDTTEDGYKESYMNRVVMPAFARGLIDSFGASHLLKCNFEDSGSGIADSQSCLCRLMTLSMVLGHELPAYKLSFHDKDKYMDESQLAAFKINHALQGAGQWYWLSDVFDSAQFAYAGDYNEFHAFIGNASDKHGVRPFALLI